MPTQHNFLLNIKVYFLDWMLKKFRRLESLSEAHLLHIKMLLHRIHLLWGKLSKIHAFSYFWLQIMGPSHLANQIVTHVDQLEGKWHPKSYVTKDVTKTTLAAIQQFGPHLTSNAPSISTPFECFEYMFLVFILNLGIYKSTYDSKSLDIQSIICCCSFIS